LRKREGRSHEDGHIRGSGLLAFVCFRSRLPSSDWKHHLGVLGALLRNSASHEVGRPFLMNTQGERLNGIASRIEFSNRPPLFFLLLLFRPLLVFGHLSTRGIWTTHPTSQVTASAFSSTTGVLLFFGFRQRLDFAVRRILGKLVKTSLGGEIGTETLLLNHFNKLEVLFPVFCFCWIGGGIFDTTSLSLVLSSPLSFLSVARKGTLLVGSWGTLGAGVSNFC
jgi:hypothetical protein